MPRLDFFIKGHDSVRKDRVEGSGGGYIIFVKQGIQYRMLGKGTEWEDLIIEIWGKEGNVRIVNFYNPCNRLTVELMDDITAEEEM